MEKRNKKMYKAQQATVKRYNQQQVNIAIEDTNSESRQAGQEESSQVNVIQSEIEPEKTEEEMRKQTVNILQAFHGVNNEQNVEKVKESSDLKKSEA